MKSTTYQVLFFQLCCITLSFGQPGELDSLRCLLLTPEVKNMSFADLLKIQQTYQNQDKAMTIAYADELLSRNDLMANDSLRALAYSEIGENYRNFGDNEKAKAYLQESIRIYERLPYHTKGSEAINRLGIYYANIDEDSLAIELLVKSMDLAQANNDTIGMIRPHLPLMSLYTKLGLFEKALSYGKVGLELIEALRIERFKSAILNNIAIAYSKMNKYDSALVYLHKALAINSKTTNHEMIIRNLSNIGSTYLFDGNVDSAAFYMARAEELLPLINVPRTFVYTYAALADVRNKQYRYREAIKYAQKAITYGKTSGIEGLTDGAYECLVQAYKGLKMPDSALVALEKYWEIKKKFLETSRNETVTRIEQQFQNFKKEKEIEIQEAEIALLKKDQTLGKTQRNGAILLAGLLGISSFLFYNRFRLKQRTSNALAIKNAEIEKQKALIEASLGEKETLLREIHHRVKNNLQIISSLLNIQSAHIQDEGILSSIQEGQSRVQAMSLIHQNLYQSEHLSNVNIENYLQELVNYLSTLYVGQHKEINVAVDASDITFDIDTAIPLGLIVNELVSNAYKYAFEKHAQGTIYIGIKALNDVDYELEVADNGVGFPSDFNAEKGNSLGLKLVKILSRQLRGSFSAQSVSGASFLVKFKDLRAYQLAQA